MSRKVIVISEETHGALKELSKRSGIKLSKLIDLAIKDLKEKLNKLLKDS